MPDIATIALVVTPRSGRDEVVGLRQGADDLVEVVVRVTAPPEGGKANKAVCKLLARELNLPKTAISVKRGDTSRHKVVEVAASADTVEAWISGLDPA